MSPNNTNLNYMFYKCEKLDAPKMNFQSIANQVKYMDYMFYGAGIDGTTTFDKQKVKFEKLVSCSDSFTDAKFGFRGTTFQFFGSAEDEEVDVNENLVGKRLSKAVTKTEEGVTTTILPADTVISTENVTTLSTSSIDKVHVFTEVDVAVDESLVGRVLSRDKSVMVGTETETLSAYTVVNIGTLTTLKAGGITTVYVFKQYVSSLCGLFSSNRWLASSAPNVIMSKSTDSIPNIEAKLSTCAANSWLPDSTAFCGGSSEIYPFGIYDFSRLYSDTSILHVDMRGISCCMSKEKVGSSKHHGMINYESMFENCTSLKYVDGHIPPFGYTYSRMFNNCRSLEIDLSKEFVVYGKENPDDITKKFMPAYSDSDSVSDELSGYEPKNISYMFNNTNKVYSSQDTYDAVTLVSKTEKTLTDNNIIPRETHFTHAFPNTVIAMKNVIEGLEQVRYDLTGISSNRHILRYCSFDDESYKKYGIGSNYMKWLFPNGFVRYGGFLKSNPSYYILVPYYPIINSSGQVVDLRPFTSSKESGLMPDASVSLFNVSAHYNKHNEWRQGKVDPWSVLYASTMKCNAHRAYNSIDKQNTLTAALVYDKNGVFVGKRYIGTWSETIHMFAIHQWSRGTYTVSSSRPHPITVYKGNITVSIPDVGSSISNETGEIDSRNAVDEKWYAELQSK